MNHDWPATRFPTEEEERKFLAEPLPTVKETETVEGEEVEVYRLADGALQASLVKMLDELPPGNLHAVFDVAKGPGEGTVTAMLALKQKAENPWSVAAGFAATFSGEWKTGLQIRKAF